jgi:hypothetical protein
VIGGRELRLQVGISIWAVRDRGGRCFKQAFPHALLMSLLLVALLACGGGSNNGQAGSMPSTIASVSPVCAPSTIAASATSQCNATVKGSGSHSSAVTWSASGGTINSSGLLTAPASASNVTVTATSTQDTTKSVPQSDKALGIGADIGVVNSHS